MLYEEDGINARTNSVTISRGAYERGYCLGGASYNAVLDVVFSDEADVLDYISLIEAQQYCKVDSFVTDAANFNTYFIRTALRQIEDYANRSFISRIVTAEIQNPNGNQVLPYGRPVGDIVQKDYSGNVITSGNIRNGRIVSGSGIFVYNAGISAEDFAASEFKTIWLQQIAWLWFHRGDETGLAGSLSPQVKSDLSKIRMV